MSHDNTDMNIGGEPYGSAGAGRARPAVAAWRARLPRIPNAGALATLIALAAVLAASLGLAACKSSSATDRDKGNEELRAMESHNARYAPPIPLSERVGCDVCPHLCQYVDLHLIPMPELLRGYRKNAEMAYDFDNTLYTDRDARERARGDIKRVACIVARSGLEVVAAFLQYLDDESPIVQVATADLALERDMARERSFATLQRVRASTRYYPGEVGFTAGVMLHRWEYVYDPLRHLERADVAQPSR